jgi:UDP-N-acetylglucosamine:LPS N-acetylglucosamine transferase
MTDLLVVCAPGGHLTSAKKILNNLSVDFKYVIHSPVDSLIGGVPVIGVIQSDRDLKFVIQIFQALSIILRERPKIILSTGAGVAVPFFIIGWVLGIKLIFVESQSRVSSLSLSGRIVLPFSTRFYVRYKEMCSINKKIIFIE